MHSIFPSTLYHPLGFPTTPALNLSAAVPCKLIYVDVSYINNKLINLIKNKFYIIIFMLMVIVVVFVQLFIIISNE